MKLIENFYCIQTEVFGNGSENIWSGVVWIKTELTRPSIQFLNADGSIRSAERKAYRKKLVVNPYAASNEYFDLNELQFLAHTYDFEIKEHDVHKGYFTSLLTNNSLYTASGTIVLVEEEKRQYLWIEFSRWKLESQPRSAGEDSLGEDTTFINGIWENPLLTDGILAKIKNTKTLQ
ncbi:hypothetical protein [Flavobacterium hungaricum]|uniref:Uncharacterized protein n=1 Tax=Flavobacterium hungaricum TaxID=2082725 RepID=A0ABR9TF56_9FLAO|nr:hypothetical protein [Flavobacterium hungaricum]MBE8723991.1 hypothetical protein [Flavobacterium hungaricum]